VTTDVAGRKDTVGARPDPLDDVRADGWPEETEAEAVQAMTGSGRRVRQWEAQWGSVSRKRKGMWERAGWSRCRL
jgi:hypothetical protein